MARRLRELGRHLAAAAPCASGRAVEETSSPSGRALGALDGAAVGSPEWLTRTGTAQRPTVPSDEPPSVVAACSGAPYSAAQTAQIADGLRADRKPGAVRVVLPVRKHGSRGKVTIPVYEGSYHMMAMLVCPRGSRAVLLP